MPSALSRNAAIACGLGANTAQSSVTHRLGRNTPAIETVTISAPARPERVTATLSAASGGRSRTTRASSAARPARSVAASSTSTAATPPRPNSPPSSGSP